ncbi:isochorismate synthase [Zymobacter palmae]|uniref:isochorismate synthase n=1 Tax=Zymobacter palmae TaxID=33074 RepID=A0A348HEP1_9GAMM|nr:isochorismate synthase [Zymobacter palmae]BBG30093.1 isochorismate synthase [Zymobacter palmae]
MRPSYQEDAAAKPGFGHAHHDGFLLSSPYRSFRTEGCQEVITHAALGGERSDSAFQKQVRQAFARARKAGIAHPILVGAIPFDTRQPSMLFIPRRHTEIDRSHWLTEAHRASRTGSAPSVLSVKARADEYGYQSAVAQAVRDMREGKLDKVVLGRQLLLDTAQRPDAQRLLARLMAQNPDSYHFSVPLPQGTLLGASPELLLRKQGHQLWSTPLAGTARRSDDATEDRLQAQALQHSLKDLHEHRVVTQAIRQRLSPVTHQLHIPEHPEVMPTTRLWHLGSSIRAEVKAADEDALTLACRLHPTPALRGFPETEAAERIARLEPEDRGPFGGIVGWCDDQGNGEWIVAIRCGVVGERGIRLFAGAGIVADSDPASEWHETANKLGTMLEAFGLDSDRLMSVATASYPSSSVCQEHHAS